MSDQYTIYFREEQRFTQWWIWLAIGLSSLSTWYAFFAVILDDDSADDTLTVKLLLWIFGVVFGIGLPIFVYSIRLIVEVRDDHLSVRFFPMLTRRIPYTDIKRYEARQYSPLREYGGWGIKGSTGFGQYRGKAYNVRGNWGVQFEMQDGENL
ncbi:MAG TPA: hypothetical protein VJZ27_20555, partial [Aggregatilineales bacterium]|nr:hypothetical protein [Aggregatilineales bacterium]